MRLLMRRPVARAYNDKGERIESMRFTVPALRVGVLDYAPGELTTNNSELDGKTVRLYYPPEAVSDVNFLKSLETAPVVVGSHDTTTGENNKKIDGWSQTVRYDDAQKAAMIDGVVKGNKEIAYIKTNIGINDFGASAFVDIYGIKVESGVTPDGQKYNAIATDLRATHVALAPHVRDPKNKIKVTNVSVVVKNTVEIKDSEEKSMDPKEIAAIVKNAVEETMKAKNADEKISELESAITEIKEALKEITEATGKTKNAKEEKPVEKKEEGKKEEEGSTVENAKPSQALVAAFATAMNIDFGKTTPSFSDLAILSGIAEKDPFARIAAVNAKFAELSKKTETSAKNTVEVF